MVVVARLVGKVGLTVRRDGLMLGRDGPAMKVQKASLRPESARRREIPANEV